jgi:hypothetical protein
MNARNVHAVIAAGVQHPVLLEKWQADPAFLRSKGIAPETIDLTALRKFAGLSIKVKHNGLRFDLPLTFRLVSLSGLDIAVFAAYATYCDVNGHRLAKTSAERAIDLTSFLETWLDLKQRNHRLLWDMIRHEQALAQLAKPAPEIPAVPADHPRSRRSTSRASLVPRVQGHVILHETQCDPQLVKSALFQRPLRLDQIPDEMHFYCYWRGGDTDEVHLLELDEFGYYTLQLVDGVTPVSELNRRMGGGRRPTPAFLGALQQLADIGILHLSTSLIPKKR